MQESHFSFALTTGGTVVPTVSGSFSFISSCLIMITILRSKQNTPYHRIIFFMSFWDSIASFSVALTTLPLPSDVVYDYAGPSYGNIASCEAQAFIISMATPLLLLSNILLNIYYLCIIRYNVEQDTFRKYAEPIFLLVAIPLSLYQPIFFATKQALNPSPYYPFCLIDVYPRECLEDNDIECIRGDTDTHRLSLLFVAIPVGIQMCILILTMLLIVHATYFRNESSEEKSAIAFQAFLYICACCITWGFAAMFSFKKTKTLNLLTLLFVPLQGFFNLLIFVSQGSRIQSV